MTDSGPVGLAPGVDVPVDLPPGGSTALAVPAVGAADPGRLRGVTAIWIRELRGRMRGKRAFIFITVYLVILVGLFWAALQTGREFWQIGALESVSFGRGIFVAVMYIEALVILALAPAYTAGLISQEREKQTFDLLSVTPISSMAIVLGKLLSGLSYLGLVVGASIPIASIAFLFGGIDVVDLVRGYALLLVTGIGIGSVGVWCSAAMQRTQPATVAAFVITALMVLGASGVWIILDSRVTSEGGYGIRPPEALLYLNPFAAMSDVVCEATGTNCVIAETLARVAEGPRPGPQVDFGDGGVGVGAAPIGAAPMIDQGPFSQPLVAGGGFWPKSALTYLLLTPIALFAAAQSISPTRRWTWNRRTRRQTVKVEAIDD
jgi:ABC-type transport system involved in multi-copper enzyme maturation permease subunit